MNRPYTHTASHYTPQPSHHPDIYCYVRYHSLHTTNSHVAVHLAQFRQHSEALMIISLLSLALVTIRMCVQRAIRVTTI